MRHVTINRELKDDDTVYFHTTYAILVLSGVQLLNLHCHTLFEDAIRIHPELGGTKKPHSVPAQRPSQP